ncbi:TetR/AcrR family transcriptional regulator [Staphylococcus sp. Marseille-Q5304]|uniref:TetR/AcrR family transcriptional regulator n=1 Tax=Staphylococcus sp. Marseille-Q5304 TaxID=2942200 RepID=UPI002072DFFD|nr:TetR/AcrR family transcriptional regulator [Staphylococcus sp. Marseille-Q5304]
MKSTAKRKIIQNMILLLKEYPFEEITIKMLCAYSGVNRTTFYKYFEDKYDLISKIQAHHLQKYLKLLDALNNSLKNKTNRNIKVYKFFKILLTYVRLHYTFFHAIIVVHPNRSLIKDYIKNTKQVYQQMLKNYSSIEHQKQMVTYIVGGEIGVIYFWIYKGCQETPEELAKILLENVLRVRRQ